MNNGEILFDMNYQTYPTGSTSYSLLKRWRKHTIYAKSGSWNRTDNPTENLYTICSTYLYDYVSITKTWYDSLIYTSSVVDSTVGGQGTQCSDEIKWWHYQNTFLDRPNAITNNYLIPTALIVENPPGSGKYIITYGPTSFIDNGEYFELVNGYPRNHLSFKRPFFSLFRINTLGEDRGNTTSGSYTRCRQTVTTTIGEDGLEDGSSPIQTTIVGNVNLIQSNNVINR